MSYDELNKAALMPLPEILPLDSIAPPLETKVRVVEPKQTVPAQRKPREEWPFVTVERHYPRIAANIHLMWGNKELEEYLNRLITSDRGDREGFPVAVHQALLKLYNQHTSLFNFQRPSDVWSHDPFAARQKQDVARAARSGGLSLQAA